MAGGNIGESVSSWRSANHNPTPALPGRLFLISRCTRAGLGTRPCEPRGGPGQIGSLLPSRVHRSPAAWYLYVLRATRYVYTMCLYLSTTPLLCPLLRWTRLALLLTHLALGLLALVRILHQQLRLTKGLLSCCQIRRPCITRLSTGHSVHYRRHLIAFFLRGQPPWPLILTLPCRAVSEVGC